jgi:hypothetical protein
LKELLVQNSCNEIIVLSEFSAFSKLPEFNYKYFDKGEYWDDIKKIIIKREEYSVVAAYIAAAAYPSMINNEKTINLLIKKYPKAAQMKPQGRGNIISTFTQTNPPLIRHMNLDNYIWNDDFNPIIAKTLIESLLLNNFHSNVPSEEEIRDICI